MITLCLDNVNTVVSGTYVLLMCLYAIETYNFTEQVNALPAEASIAEGNDLYIRLQNPADIPSTCELVPPISDSVFTIERDDNYVDTCGFIVKNVTPYAEGKWEIVYGNKIIYKASISVTVTGNFKRIFLNKKHSLSVL